MDLISELIARAREDVAGTLLLATVTLVAGLKLQTIFNSASVCDPAERSCVETTVGSNQQSRKLSDPDRGNRQPSSVKLVSERDGQTRAQQRTRKNKATMAPEKKIRQLLYRGTVHD